MASWIISSIALCFLATVCLGIEHLEEYEHHIPEADAGLVGEEILEHQGHELLHHEHKPATSYQNFNLESKNPVPVVIKKEFLHQAEGHEIGLGNDEFFEHHLEEPTEFKGF